MKTDRQTKIIAVIAMLVAIGGLSIAFAALNQNITIDGSATVSKIGFKVEFQDLVKETPTGLVTIITEPTISASTTHVGDYDVIFTSPESSISYTMDIVNTGTLDAVLGSIDVPTPICTGTGENALVDAENVCNNLTYTLTYSDGSAIQVGDSLAAGDSENVRLTLSYGEITVDELAKESVSISNLSININYTQS